MDINQLARERSDLKQSGLAVNPVLIILLLQKLTQLVSGAGAPWRVVNFSMQSTPNH